MPRYTISDLTLRRRLYDECAIDLDSVPPLLLEADIVRDPKDPGRRGLLPMTSASFRDAVSKHLIAPPVMLGPDTEAWKRIDILKVLLDGTRDARRILRTRGVSPAAPAELPTN